MKNSKKNQIVFFSKNFAQFFFFSDFFDFLRKKLVFLKYRKNCSINFGIFVKVGKWKIFRFVGKFSDLSENFPQLKIFQFIKFGKKIFRFFQIGKFSTCCKCSNSSDFIEKISSFSIQYENWHTYRPGRINFRKRIGKLSSTTNI